MIKNEWQIFLWAMLHSDRFHQCYIRFPVRFLFRKSKNYRGSIWSLEMHLHPLGFYVPYPVFDAYEAAHGRERGFDDIPF